MIRINHITNIVGRVKKKIEGLDPLDMETNVEEYRCRHLKEVPIFKEGCVDLNRLQKRPLPTTQVNREINEVLEKDKKTIGERVERINKLARPNQQRVLVRFMEKPEREELITVDFLVYLELRWHLVHTGIADKLPDVWLRHQNLDPNSTPNHYHWKYIRPRENIHRDRDLLEIDIVEIGHINQSAYMVAVLHDKEPDQQRPVPLVIGRGNWNGCRESCRNLLEHLEHLWPLHTVTQAIQFSSRQKNTQEVLHSPLMDDFFDLLTNDLYLLRLPRNPMKKLTTIPHEAKQGPSEALV